MSLTTRAKLMLWFALTSLVLFGVALVLAVLAQGWLLVTLLAMFAITGPGTLLGVRAKLLRESRGTGSRA